MSPSCPQHSLGKTERRILFGQEEDEDSDEEQWALAEAAARQARREEAERDAQAKARAHREAIAAAAYKGGSIYDGNGARASGLALSVLAKSMADR